MAQSESVSHSVVPDILCDARLLCPWDFSGKNTGGGCHFLLQGIFPTRGWNLGLLHCRHFLYRLSHRGDDSYNMILEEGWMSSHQEYCLIYNQQRSRMHQQKVDQLTRWKSSPLSSSQTRTSSQTTTALTDREARCLWRMGPKRSHNQGNILWIKESAYVFKGRWI